MEKKHKLKYMKIVIIGLLFSIMACAQSTNDDFQILNTINQSDELEISNQQKNQLLKLKKEAAKNFEMIGRDQSLSGYDKGIRKKEISITLYNQLNQILTNTQREKLYRNLDYEAFKEYSDYRIAVLENQYNKDIIQIKTDNNLTKEEKKEHIKQRKEKYKLDKKKEKNKRV